MFVNAFSILDSACRIGRSLRLPARPRARRSESAAGMAASTDAKVRQEGVS
jgi:hypothetical protein